MGHDDDDERPPFKHNKIEQYDLNSKIMLTAIISLSIVVILIAILHLYAKCIIRRRQAALGRMPIISPNNNPSLVVRSIDPPKTGLDPLVVALLPTFLIKTIDDEMECSICLSSLQQNQVARTLPNCKHSFHAECIDTWFQSHPNCPICRTEAEPRQVLIMAEPREGMAAPPSALPLEGMDDSMEGSDTNALLQSPSSSNKIGGSSVSRLSSFRRIVSRERSSRRNPSQSSCLEDGTTNNGLYEDLERQ